MTRVSRNKIATAPCLLFNSARPTANRQNRRINESIRNVWSVTTDRSSAIDTDSRSVSTELLNRPSASFFQWIKPPEIDKEVLFSLERKYGMSRQRVVPRSINLKLLRGIIALSLDCTNPVEKDPIC